MTTFKNTSAFIFLTIFGMNALAAVPVRPVNIVIVLDLSDRLLATGQASRDQTAIMAAFDYFENTVRKQFFIKSKDVFSVVIIPQKGSKLKAVGFEEMLRLDMGAISVSKKSTAFASFKARLTPALQSLYANACQGKKTTDYFGVDVWQFFNQSLNNYLLPAATNKVIVLTDGYFDFENDTHAVHTKNRFTSSRFMKGLSGTAWKQTAQKKDLGIYPVQNKIIACEVIIAGLSAKFEGQFELDKLKYFWDKWLVECGLTRHKLIANVNAMQLSSTLKAALL